MYMFHCSEWDNRMKGGNKSGDGIWMPYHLKGIFKWAHAPSVAYLVLRKLEEAVNKWPKILHECICTNLMMPVWGRLLFKLSELVVYIPSGGAARLVIINAKVFCSWVFFTHPTHDLAAQVYNQGFGTVNCGVFTALG